jgi:hypothetical protein
MIAVKMSTNPLTVQMAGSVHTVDVSIVYATNQNKKRNIMAQTVTSKTAEKHMEVNNVNR